MFQAAFIAFIVTATVAGLLAWNGTKSLWRGGLSASFIAAWLLLGPLLALGVVTRMIGVDYRSLGPEWTAYGLIAGCACFWAYIGWHYWRR